MSRQPRFQADLWVGHLPMFTQIFDKLVAGDIAGATAVVNANGVEVGNFRGAVNASAVAAGYDPTTGQPINPVIANAPIPQVSPGTTHFQLPPHAIFGFSGSGAYRVSVGANGGSIWTWISLSPLFPNDPALTSSAMDQSDEIHTPAGNWTIYTKIDGDTPANNARLDVLPI